MECWGFSGQARSAHGLARESSLRCTTAGGVFVENLTVSAGVIGMFNTSAVVGGLAWQSGDLGFRT